MQNYNKYFISQTIYRKKCKKSSFCKVEFTEWHLSPYQVFQFDVGMAVLTLLESLATIDADSLMRANMYAREADGTVVADMGFLLDHNIAHRADTRAGLATGTFGFVDYRMECAQHAVLQE